jgi:hypothetical protein
VLVSVVMVVGLVVVDDDAAAAVGIVGVVDVVV